MMVTITVIGSKSVPTQTQFAKSIQAHLRWTSTRGGGDHHGDDSWFYSFFPGEFCSFNIHKVLDGGDRRCKLTSLKHGAFKQSVATKDRNVVNRQTNLLAASPTFDGYVITIVKGIIARCN